MDLGHRVLPPGLDPKTPPPADTAEFALERTTPQPAVTPPAPRPTPEQVLGWVAAAPGPWFPSAHARATGVSRDALDDPLNDLRAAGLLAVAEWVRGTGQGYVLTPEGRAATSVPAAAAPAAGPPPDGDPGLPEPVGIDPRPPVVTPVLLLANVLWFLAGVVVAHRLGVPVWTYLTGRSPPALERLGAVSGPDLLAGDWWRLGASCFVHVGLLHLVVNVAAIGIMGPLAELLWGRWRTLAVYALSGLAGGCLAMAVHPSAESGAPILVAGASGAIWGVMTSLAAWLLLFRADLAPDMAADWGRQLGRMLILNVGVSFIPGVSWEAHLGGGVAGFVAAGLLNALRFGDRPRRVGAAVLLVLMPVGCVAGLVGAMRDGDAWAPLRRHQAAEQAARRAAAVREQTRAAVEAFDQEVAPLLAAVRPEKVGPVEERAATLALAGRAGGPAGAEARAAAAGLRAAAAAAAEKLADPTGVDALDDLRARARAFADARVRSLDRLLGLLDAGGVPDPAAWRAWADARREADKLWVGAGRP